MGKDSDFLHYSFPLLFDWKTTFGGRGFPKMGTAGAGVGGRPSLMTGTGVGSRPWCWTDALICSGETMLSLGALLDDAGVGDFEGEDDADPVAAAAPFC